MSHAAGARPAFGARFGTAALLLAGAGLAALLVVLYLYNPLQVGFYPRCPLYLLTGIYCPGCGALRATHALLHGHVITALGYNAFYVLTVPFLAYSMAGHAARWMMGRAILPTVRISPRQAKALLFAMLAFSVLRNVPVYPFNLLAP
ncbi:MAG TPA: DUF2752 domain-containing protein [Longimicrobium sp.]|nr:DUF2752 domain-containing protein [Longimicrobium sp.]